MRDPRSSRTPDFTPPSPPADPQLLRLLLHHRVHRGDLLQGDSVRLHPPPGILLSVGLQHARSARGSSVTYLVRIQVRIREWVWLYCRVQSGLGCNYGSVFSLLDVHCALLNECGVL